MERSIESIVAGGLALLAGLWTLEAAQFVGRWHLAGGVVAVLGLLAIGAGIARDLHYGPLAE
ncbi:hypothetical protein L593_03185 [Salinarchaeum sp. Harcht-Bsk1]|uniref:hypothetical protein n=1 Tax=Salinarchaeum sp. Harcht-Bsk1 TaxID=1333523 RepID=UPI0003423441|nr:hypothetical protein [Salinarchaeum sp. Harcht-Bsk1]AGN00588.1 hypothetical protein L593_03185 [Salinarchaeum sp. Harcht-Bsk1]